MSKPVNNTVQAGQLNYIHPGQLNHVQAGQLNNHVQADQLNNHVQASQLNYVQACQQAKTSCAFLRVLLMQSITYQYPL